MIEPDAVEMDSEKKQDAPKKKMLGFQAGGKLSIGFQAGGKLSIDKDSEKKETDAAPKYQDPARAGMGANRAGIGAGVGAKRSYGGGRRPFGGRGGRGRGRGRGYSGGGYSGGGYNEGGYNEGGYNEGGYSGGGYADRGPDRGGQRFGFDAGHTDPDAARAQFENYNKGFDMLHGKAKKSSAKTNMGFDNDEDEMGYGADIEPNSMTKGYGNRGKTMGYDTAGIDRNETKKKFGAREKFGMGYGAVNRRQKDRENIWREHSDPVIQRKKPKKMSQYHPKSLAEESAYRVQPDIMPGKTRIWIGGLPTRTPEAKVRRLMRTIGEPIDVRIGPGWAMVTMDSQEKVYKAIQLLDRTRFANGWIKVKLAPDPAIWVGDLPIICTNELLEVAFSYFGNVTRAIVVCDEEGRSAGYGFVEFRSAAAVTRTVEACNEKPFVLSRSSQPVRVEPFKFCDDDVGLNAESLLWDRTRSMELQEKCCEPRMGDNNELSQAWLKQYQREKLLKQELKKSFEDERREMRKKQRKSMLMKNRQKEQKELTRLEELKAECRELELLEMRKNEEMLDHDLDRHGSQWGSYGQTNTSTRRGVEKKNPYWPQEPKNTSMFGTESFEAESEAYMGGIDQIESETMSLEQQEEELKRKYRELLLQEQTLSNELGDVNQKSVSGLESGEELNPYGGNTRMNSMGGNRKASRMNSMGGSRKASRMNSMGGSREASRWAGASRGNDQASQWNNEFSDQTSSWDDPMGGTW